MGTELQSGTGAAPQRGEAAVGEKRGQPGAQPRGNEPYLMHKHTPNPSSKNYSFSPLPLLPPAGSVHSTPQSTLRLM